MPKLSSSINLFERKKINDTNTNSTCDRFFISQIINHLHFMSLDEEKETIDFETSNKSMRNLKFEILKYCIRILKFNFAALTIVEEFIESDAYSVKKRSKPHL